MIKLPDIGRISAEVFNELLEPKFGMNLIEHGNEKKLQHPIVDPFWQAFSKHCKREARMLRRFCGRQ